MTHKPHATFHDLKDKHVFITGGGSGIGAALTAGFLGQGAKVSFIQRSDATDFVKQMGRDFTTPTFIPCDISDIAALQTAMQTAEEAHGAIDVLVNNAGNDVRHTIAETTVDDWDKNHAVNLRPYFFTSQWVAPKMRKRGGGAIINYSSISYLMGQAGFAAYTTANAGISGMTRVLARELGVDNIRVNTLVPGWVLTQKQMDKWATPEGLAKHLDRQCLPQHLMADDMVEPTLFLASDASKMMTGQMLIVDGGAV